jgi:THO complex subunit 3
VSEINNQIMNASFLEKRKPCSPDRFPLLFTKQRTTAYLDNVTPAGKPVVGSSLSNPSSYIRTLAWNPVGSLVATGSGDRKLRVWNPERNNVKYSTELKGHSGSIERVAFHPGKEAELASLSVDGTVRLWDVRTATNVAEIKTIGKECFTMAWKPDGNEFIVISKVSRPPKRA